MSTSHLSGAPVYVEGRHLRQLCQWCGHRLIDVDVNNIQVPEKDADTPYPEWPIGKWIRVDGALSSVIEEPSDGKMPIDSCMHDVSSRVRAVPDPEPKEPDEAD